MIYAYAFSPENAIQTAKDTGSQNLNLTYLSMHVIIFVKNSGNENYN